jgi:hypothetical protein
LGTTYGVGLYCKHGIYFDNVFLLSVATSSPYDSG